MSGGGVLSWVYNAVEILVGRVALHPVWYSFSTATLLLFTVLSRKLWPTLTISSLFTLADEVVVFGPDRLKLGDIVGCFCVDGHMYPTHELISLILLVLGGVSLVHEEQVSEVTRKTVAFTGATIIVGALLAWQRSVLTPLAVIGVAVLGVALMNGESVTHGGEGGYRIGDDKGDHKGQEGDKG